MRHYVTQINPTLQQAVKERVSDIHFEPYEKELEVSFRMNGVLRKVLSLSKLIQDALVKGIKVMVSMKNIIT